MQVVKSIGPEDPSGVTQTNEQQQQEPKLGALHWVPASFVYSAVLQQLLIAAQFDFAFELIDQAGTGEGLAMDKCERLVLSAAREYFNSASSADSEACHVTDGAGKQTRIVPPQMHGQTDANVLSTLRVCAPCD